MNKYNVRFQTSDERLWEVVVKADGILMRDLLVVFWNKQGPFGLFHYDVHYIAIDLVVSIVKQEGNAS